MKLGKSVLLEIVSIVQDGLVNGTDVSAALRQIDVEVGYAEEDGRDEAKLSEEYLKARGRV